MRSIEPIYLTPSGSAGNDISRPQDHVAGRAIIRCAQSSTRCSPPAYRLPIALPPAPLPTLANRLLPFPQLPPHRHRVRPSHRSAHGYNRGALPESVLGVISRTGKSYAAVTTPSSAREMSGWGVPRIDNSLCSIHRNARRRDRSVRCCPFRDVATYCAESTR